MTSNLHVAVLMGGPSMEREVSLQSGHVVAQALRDAGLRVSEVDVRGSDFAVPPGTDVAYLALHGTFGEDGTIQQLLEQRGVPYTGSGPEASARAFDKVAAKKAFHEAGLQTAQHAVLERGDHADAGELERLGFPVVVKPVRQGSSVGVSIAKNADELGRACRAAWEFDDQLLVEQFVCGREFTVAVFGEQTLPVVEIRTRRRFFDREAKYTPGEAEEIVPAEIDTATTARIQGVGRRAHACLGCRDLSRTDMILSAHAEVFVLEVNTLPGVTKNSLFPKAARAAGLDFPEVCTRLVEMAWARRAKRKK
jgi:D-alanine-D-alanine ligase